MEKSWDIAMDVLITAKKVFFKNQAGLSDVFVYIIKK